MIMYKKMVVVVYRGLFIVYEFILRILLIFAV